MLILIVLSYKDWSSKKGRIWLPKGLHFISVLLNEFHATPTRRHMGITKTLARVRENFIWTEIKDDVWQFVEACIDCQHTKYDNRKQAGLLCPLSVSSRPWDDLSLDFIVGLPTYCGHTAILVIVDHFSKGIHLGMLHSHFIAHLVAILFMEVVGKIHGMPRSLVSDCDPLLISCFWQELFRMSRTKLSMSSAYHP